MRIFLQALTRAKLLKDRTAVVSGGSSGIGLAAARVMAEAGAVVTSADLNPPPEKDAGVIAFRRTDVTRAADVRALAEQRAGERAVDLLVLSAGRGIHQRLPEGDPETWQAIVEINFLGALRLVRAFVPAMIAAGRGDVVFISSVAAEKAYSWGGVYAASKAALA
ncbi:MAG: SDR family NAD(P)-dependent oxidoreductase, partial [Candidatus Promineifilaceae bacterium]|nr:SDR family NAD(P)-dependent oxidoreductase [Candidatus Promineifilaceae bacterium]